MLLDTNALFLPIRSGFPLEAEIDRLFPGARVLVADSGVRELDRLVDRSTPGAAAARSLAERFVRTVAASEGDEAVVEVAVREGAIVVTADRELQTRLGSKRNPGARAAGPPPTRAAPGAFAPRSATGREGAPQQEFPSPLALSR